MTIERLSRACFAIPPIPREGVSPNSRTRLSYELRRQWGLFKRRKRVAPKVPVMGWIGPKYSNPIGPKYANFGGPGGAYGS